MAFGVTFSQTARRRRLPSFRRRVASPRSTALPWYGVVILFGMCFAIWELISQLKLVDPFIISRPSWIAATWWEQVKNGLYLHDMEVTLKEFVISYLLAAVVGIVLGFIAGWYRRFRYSVEALIWFFYNAPLVAFYPLLIIWLGVGTPTIVALAFLLSFFPIYMNTQTGVMLINPLLIQCARSFGAGTPRIFVHIALPAAIPPVVAGLRLGVGRALVGVIVGELIGGTGGFGFRMSYAANYLNPSLYFEAILSTTIIGVIITDLLKRLENHLDRYRTS